MREDRGAQALGATRVSMAALAALYSVLKNTLQLLHISLVLQTCTHAWIHLAFMPWSTYTQMCAYSFLYNQQVKCEGIYKNIGCKQRNYTSVLVWQAPSPPPTTTNEIDYDTNICTSLFGLHLMSTETNLCLRTYQPVLHSKIKPNFTHIHLSYILKWTWRL